MTLASLASAALMMACIEPAQGVARSLQVTPRPSPSPPAIGAGGVTPAPCLQFGAAVGSAPLFSDPDYAAVVRNWMAISSFTVETSHKFRFIRFGPGTGDYDFSAADLVIQELRSYGYGREGMAFHTLFWHNRFQLDPWVETLGLQGTRTVIQEHINAVHDHYFQGPSAIPVNRIDVINEAMGDNWRLRAPGPAAENNPWAQAGTPGAGHVDWAVFAIDRAQSIFPPETKLFYNDYGIEFGTIDPNPSHPFDPSGATHLSKADAVYKLVRDHLQPAGLDGVGIQTHLIMPYYQNVSGLRAMIQQYAAIGVEVHITELDIAIDTGAAAPSAAQLQQQASLYADVLGIAAEEPNCKQVTVWGVTDRQSWIPAFAPHCPGCVAPLPHDDFGQPKPAYWAIQGVFGATLRACSR